MVSVSRVAQTLASPAPDAVPGSRAVSGSGGLADPPTWPQAKCSTPGCDTVTRAYKKMLSKTLYHHVQASISDLDDAWDWHHKCVNCIMAEDNCTSAETWAIIYKQLKNPQWARERSVKYKEAVQQRNANPDMEGMSRKGKRKLALADIAELPSPLVKL